MNRKLKSISAALLAAAMCASFTGCANNEKSDSLDSNTESSTTTSGDQSSTESEPESESTDTSKPEKPADLPEITFAATDEIKNAGFDSGLVQWYNDVFQCGGYVSVPEFIKKYSASYDFEYMNKPIDEGNLSASVESSFWEDGKLLNIRINGTPKFTVKGSEKIEDIIVQIINPNDKPVPLSECYVSYVWGNKYAYGVRAGGFIADDGKLSDLVDVSAPEYLKSLGYEEMKRPSSDGYELKPSMEYDKKFFKDEYDNYYFYNVGEPNAFGARPFYRSDIGFGGRVTVPHNVGYIFE